MYQRGILKTNNTEQQDTAKNSTRDPQQPSNYTYKPCLSSSNTHITAESICHHAIVSSGAVKTQSHAVSTHRGATRRCGRPTGARPSKSLDCRTRVRAGDLPTNDQGSTGVNHTIGREEQRLRAAMKARGLDLAPFGSAGAVRVAGRGVYVLAAGMRYLDARDLEPCDSTPREAQQLTL